MLRSHPTSSPPMQNRLNVRTTTGQSISLRYDPATNAIVFDEDDWFAGTFRSSAVPPKAQYRERLSGAAVVELKVRRRARA